MWISSSSTTTRMALAAKPSKIWGTSNNSRFRRFVLAERAGCDARAKASHSSGTVFDAWRATAAPLHDATRTPPVAHSSGRSRHPIELGQPADVVAEIHHPDLELRPRPALLLRCSGFASVAASMSARKSSHGTIFLIVSSGSPLALIASSLCSKSKKLFCPMTRSLPRYGQRVRFAATWREEFFEAPISLHVFRWHQANLVAEPRQLTRPIMRRGTGLHADQAGRQRCKKLHHLSTPKLLPDDHLLGRVNAVNLEHVLRDIQTDRGNLHVDGSLM